MTPPNETAGLLPLAVVLLGAAVFSVPLARKLKLSAIMAYLVAGMLIGPYGLRVINNPDTVLTVAELGIVMLLFIVGLELELTKLLHMRRAIFGLGATQLVGTALVIGLGVFAAGLAGWRGAIVAGLALALSTTSVALSILEERGDLQQPYGQRAFAVLLFQDMAVVPLLAILPIAAGFTPEQTAWGRFGSVGLALAAIAAVVVAGRYLLNPFFRLLAQTGAREVMTAAALLVVLGTALLMQAVGMSMALGAFLAGVLLAESNFRHELEADIEPFRGLLLALFFMGIGIGIDFKVVWAHLGLILAAAVLVTIAKAVIVGILFRATCQRPEDGLRAGAILTGAGEFAFVLLPLGASLGLIGSEPAVILTCIASVTLLLGPPTASLGELILRRAPKEETPPALDAFEDVHGRVLLIGFGRFGQMASQCLLAAGVDVTIIDNDPEMIEAAGHFGFNIYYGDGTRLDVLRAAGVGDVSLVAVCVDQRASADRIVSLVRGEFDGVKLFVRSYDRGHTLALIAAGVDYELRETYESAIVFGRHALEALGTDSERAQEIEEDVRRRDVARLVLQQAGGLFAGVDLLPTGPTPEPLRAPRRGTTALNPEAGDIIRREKEPQN
ncbi:MAG: monovalent cation:proton antiporter-2 (CPA2) family protein [Variibacter sp.]